MADGFVFRDLILNFFPMRSDPPASGADHIFGLRMLCSFGASIFRLRIYLLFVIYYLVLSPWQARHCTVYPPSITTACPVIPFALSPDRKYTYCATSSALSKRFWGTRG